MANEFLELDKVKDCIKLLEQAATAYRIAVLDSMPFFDDDECSRFWESPGLDELSDLGEHIEQAIKCAKLGLKKAS